MVFTVTYPMCIVLQEEMTGDQLRRIRKRLGLTQEVMAAKLGVSPNTVARWERNEVAISEPAARLARLTLEMERRKRR